MAERHFTDQESARRSKLAALRDGGYDPFAIVRVDRTSNLGTFKFKHVDADDASLAKVKDVSVLGGRIVALRQMFAVLADQSGRLQVFADKAVLKGGQLAAWKHLDIGDIVEVKGTPMRTRTGELTLRVADFRLISKSLRPLPEKWAGLTDEEERARRRYVDLIVSQESMDVFIARSKILTALRDYMTSIGYLEVETPILQDVLGGAAAKPFVTTHNALDRNFYLRIATELHLKRLIVGGFEKVFEIGRVFRNEGMDATHNPEFTTMEAYAAYQDMSDMMALAEGSLRFIAERLGVKEVNAFGNKTDIFKPYRRVHMADLVREKSGVDFWKVDSSAKAVALAKKHKIDLQPHQKSFGHVLNLFFEHFCEKDLIDPTFVFGHPVEISPLAKKSPKDPRFTERFELFVGGKEIANAFSELNDPIDQYERFASQLQLRELGDEEANEMDTDFVEALEYGMPPTGGIGMGIDRMVMLFTGKTTIRDVLLFPHMRKR